MKEQDIKSLNNVKSKKCITSKFNQTSHFNNIFNKTEDSEREFIDNNLQNYAVNSQERIDLWLDELTSKKTTPIVRTKANKPSTNDNLNFKFESSDPKVDKNTHNNPNDNDTVDYTID